ncbi:hypothetical protein IMG5_166500 [Ichthyophthirius multifiliis]|uniref:EF-hand domain-containing protein n=1 Tax=Ichthyophthirius multifiliis TaxID=5932 RepID=G0R0R8_ICHMU|nr:hypothetical protein IMG5_166500 [Ichthyophthirius multifiliis]EGR28930.1 hypothetical protein IMG5_166500 [Ichthyophthirius multifiliis]|eukprot:XP_004030166.1 hypothetical protein IMG5_166500 [Ichthyophthirius multifiliis]
MMLLDNDKLAALEDEFNEHPNGIELANFVWLMKCAIMHSQEEKYELINGLIKLFEDIDINGDQHMEWSEFTQYIIDAVIGEKDAIFFDARFEREREMTEQEIFDRAYSKKSKRYFPCKYFDNMNHQGHIIKAIYSPHIDAVISLEQNSSKLKYYYTECKEIEIQQKKVIIQPPAEDKLQPFIIDFTIAEQLNTIAIVASNRQFYFWENNLSMRCIKIFKHDVLQTGIFYLPIHKMWITAGADYNIRTWKFNQFQDQEKIHHDKLMIAHLKTITKIEELMSPRLIASSSLDGKIKLWDLTDPSNPPILITELRDPNSSIRGVLGLTYSCHYGSNLLSYGFDYHINIWCPEVSITRPFIGKLEGHSSLVQICKFMDFSPNVISVDDKCNVRIWDIRGMNTIQVINSDGQFSIIYDACIIYSQKKDMFILTGKRLAFFENLQFSGKKLNINDDVYPLSIQFNYYYKQFCILTKNDMRMYDAMTGKLKKVFNDLQDEKYPVDLSTFCLGARQRKFFVADNVGLIRQYNMKNGSQLKLVNTTDETESQDFTKKQITIKKKENNQISQILYLTEEKLLIASYWDSTVRIYDEEDSEETVLLKIMTGGHKDSEITTLTYSEKFKLIASASSNGYIAIWEFETGKLESILVAREKGDITTMSFGEPYPILITGGTSGVLNIWGIKGAPTQYIYRSIGRFINSYSENDKIKENLLVFPTENVVFFNENDNFYSNSNQQSTAANSVNAGEKYFEKQIDYQYYYKQYETTREENKRRFYVVVGDQKGMVHVWNLTEYLQKRNIIPIKNDKKKKYQQLRRKDFINASKTVDFILSSPERRNEKLPFYTHAFNSILIKRWTAHQNLINFILRIPQPLCYATCSQDKCVKFFNLQGDCWANISLVKFGKNQWSFPFDWVEYKLQDMKQVFEQLENLENQQLNDEDQNKIKLKYLSNQYFQENTFEKVKEEKYNRIFPPKVISQEEQEIIEKKELYTYKYKPKPYIDPISQLKKQIKEEDELAKIRDKKKEPFKKIKVIEEYVQEDVNSIKQFYNAAPKTKNYLFQNTNLQYFNNNLELIQQGQKIDINQNRVSTSTSKKENKNDNQSKIRQQCEFIIYIFNLFYYFYLEKKNLVQLINYQKIYNKNIHKLQFNLIKTYQIKLIQVSKNKIMIFIKSIAFKNYNLQQKTNRIYIYKYLYFY